MYDIQAFIKEPTSVPKLAMHFNFHKLSSKVLLIDNMHVNQS